MKYLSWLADPLLRLRRIEFKRFNIALFSFRADIFKAFRIPFSNKNLRRLTWINFMGKRGNLNWWGAVFQENWKEFKARMSKLFVLVACIILQDSYDFSQKYRVVLNKLIKARIGCPGFRRLFHFMNAYHKDFYTFFQQILKIRRLIHNFFNQKRDFLHLNHLIVKRLSYKWATSRSVIEFLISKRLSRHQRKVFKSSFSRSFFLKKSTKTSSNPSFWSRFWMLNLVSANMFEIPQSP